MLETHAGGVVLRLLPQRAAYLADPGLLLVADLHIGKAMSFRRLGVPVPGGTTARSLARLDEALAATQARGIVFLGDLLHSASGRADSTLSEFTRWRRQHPQLELTLVRGNHDSHAGDPPPQWEVRCVNGPLRCAGLALAHHPEPVPGAYVLAGHLHPAAVVTGRARQRLRLPCFHFGAAVGVLPAFGEFTGAQVLPRTPADRVFVVADDQVRALN